MEYAAIISPAEILLLIVIAIFIIFYVVLGITLTKFNKLKYGVGTALGWIPICNVYLMGKLTFNKLVGWLLVIGLYLSSSTEITINGETTTSGLLPSSIQGPFTDIYNIVYLIIFIYMFISYFRLKKEKTLQSPQSPALTQNIQPAPVLTPENIISQSMVASPELQQVQEEPTVHINQEHNIMEEPVSMAIPTHTEIKEAPPVVDNKIEEINNLNEFFTPPPPSIEQLNNNSSQTTENNNEIL